jgi:hypothetical protein
MTLEQPGLIGLQSRDEASFARSGAVEERVLVVQRLTGEVHLRHQSIRQTGHVEVNVGRPKQLGPGRIAAGLDGPECVAAACIAREQRVSVEAKICPGVHACASASLAWRAVAQAAAAISVRRFDSTMSFMRGSSMTYRCTLVGDGAATDSACGNEHAAS